MPSPQTSHPYRKRRALATNAIIPPRFFYCMQLGKEKGTCNYDSESITSLDLEAFTFDAKQSFGSVPSILQNCVQPSEKDSTSSSASFETDSSINNYATGRSSPIGATFLETLFSLYARDHNLKKEVGPKDLYDEYIISQLQHIHLRPTQH
ncbi:uncharacterized protein HKW66_Vig0244800 [Vigna angularis]|uniref:Uncharacterized protein n=1 Tax=Phaseolus angularis TaxID=3914 RepID=A0A8T0L358_PHAAN|nr:uncharacterized protein HKW66_Vig0244800 [Vigna angularis]